MSDKPPTPTEFPDGVVNTLDECSPERLREIAGYVEELAEYREREARCDGEVNESELEGHPEEIPDDVPSKATLTIKEINDNRYYYWQWREGDKIRSQYDGPVNPDKE